jgi:hypothetical protein
MRTKAPASRKVIQARTYEPSQAFLPRDYLDAIILAILPEIQYLAARPRRQNWDFDIPDVGVLRLNFDGMGVATVDMASSHTPRMLVVLHTLHRVLGDRLVWGGSWEAPRE